ncbi:hypothetical protein FQA39_LY15022 [Lamprigera yunnana]|nr:hypothetical protein FQA39_LY15022 [Lamprigera yunnana]
MAPKNIFVSKKSFEKVSKRPSEHPYECKGSQKIYDLVEPQTTFKSLGKSAVTGNSGQLWIIVVKEEENKKSLEDDGEVNGFSSEERFVKFGRLYFVVEFPEEVNENGPVSMAVISSSNWTIIEDNVRYCMWPYYLNTDKLRTKAVVNHMDLDFPKCAKCEIIVKYTISIYNVAVSKLKCLEDASSVSQSKTENGPRKRYRKRNNLLLNSDCDRVSEQSSSEQTDDDAPVTPILRRTIPVLQKNVEVQESAGSCSSSSRSFKPLSVFTPMTRRQPISNTPTVSHIASSDKSAYASSSVCLNF